MSLKAPTLNSISPRAAYAPPDVDVYESLFGPLRFHVRNVTEIGIALGQGLQVWHDYFVNAQIWGVDVQISCVKHARKVAHYASRAIWGHLGPSGGHLGPPRP